MWEEYIQEARSHMHTLKDRSYEIRYEDLLADPKRVIKNVANFCELRVSDMDIDMVSSHLNSERSYVYRNHPELVAFAEKASERLKANGY